MSSVIVDVDSSDIAQLWWTAEIVLPSNSVVRKMTSICLQLETGNDSPCHGVDFWTGVEWAAGSAKHLGFVGGAVAAAY